MSQLSCEGAHTLSAVERCGAATLESGLLPGTRYRVLAPLAAGAMGELFAAWHVDRAEIHAVKVLSARLARHAELKRRMADEAKALELVRHPRVVGLRASGQLDDGRPFVAMDLLAGESLRRRLDRPAAPTVSEANRWAVQLLDALDAVHRAGVAHGDVKPSNLMVGPTGSLTLVDFGAAELGVTALGSTRTRAERASSERRGPPGRSWTTPRAALGADALATRVERRRRDAPCPEPSGRGASPHGPGLRSCGRSARVEVPSSRPSEMAPAAARRRPSPRARARLLIGTPKYMSPARQAGAAPSREADLYAAGRVLGELAARVGASGTPNACRWARQAAAIAHRACKAGGPGQFASAAHVARALRQLAGFFCSRRWRSCFSRQTARRRSRRRRLRRRELEFCGMAEAIAQTGARRKRLCTDGIDRRRPRHATHRPVRHKLGTDPAGLVPLHLST